MKPIKVYQDKSGNTLWKRYIKNRESWELYAKNKNGQVVNRVGVLKLIDQARAIKHFKIPKSIPVKTINVGKTKVRTYNI